MASRIEPTVHEALDILRGAYGPDAEFREGQLEAIAQAIQPGSRTLVVQPTGWGKSIVYFVATAWQRRRGGGCTVVVSPLLALMRNQVAMAARFGLRAATMDSTNADEWIALAHELDRGEIDVLLVSPERLGHPFFRDHVAPLLEDTANLIVVDEAHCISEWGHDFRPDYQRIGAFVESLRKDASVLATTATATRRVEADLRNVFGSSLKAVRGPLIRPSLRLSVFAYEDLDGRLAWLAKYVPKMPGVGIVYTLTVHDAEMVAAFLNEVGIDARPYHGQLAHAERVELEQAFEANEMKALVATSALGMGYDKGDIGFIVHFQLPPSILTYYQQVGRAGRAVPTAYGVLLWGETDLDITDHFFQTALPPKAVFQRLLDAVGERKAGFGELVKLGPADDVDRALGLLEAHGVLMRDSEGYRRVPNSGPEAFSYDRLKALVNVRTKEREAMVGYATGAGCRMKVLAKALGDPTSRDCGRCDHCAPHAEVRLEPDRLDEARAFLRGRRYAIPSKSRWPESERAAAEEAISVSERLEEGLALALYNDGGYGRLVRRDKYGGKGFSAELVEAAAGAIREAGWPVEWLTWVPSRRTSHVEDFARGLARLLGIEAVEAVEKIRDNAPQKAMRSRRLQWANVDQAFAVRDVRGGACLLVDDLVDSGWTLTVIGTALRRAGSGPVYPFALAAAHPRRAR